MHSHIMMELQFQILILINMLVILIMDNLLVMEKRMEQMYLQYKLHKEVRGEAKDAFMLKQGEIFQEQKMKFMQWFLKIFINIKIW